MQVRVTNDLLLDKFQTDKVLTGLSYLLPSSGKVNLWKLTDKVEVSPYSLVVVYIPVS